MSPYNISSKIVLPQEVTVYDSTLRDGEQMPGVHFTVEQKTAIANKLDEVGVHQIEAGFPAVSDGERLAVKTISKLGLDADILCLARTLNADIDAAIDCDVDMVLLFVATSELHLRYKLKMKPEEIVERARSCVEYAHAHGLKASISTEDSTRSDLGLMLDVYHACEEVGASRLGMTDTLGCAGPDAINYLVRKIRADTRLPLSAHLHNDFGLGVANAVAALAGGAEAIATTVGGIGERAGNVPLEQIVMALKHIHKKDIGIKTEGLTDLTKLVFEAANIPIPPNQPWVGPNAFSHESGIHVAAVLNCPMTYECVDPEEVGNRRRLVLGKHSGTAIVKSRLGEKGIEASQEQICDVVRAIKKAGEDHGRVSDDEFWKIVDEVMRKGKPNPDCV
ncbi:MAG TPA: homoaconitate hydratase [Candidatus Paceibacterota bacterium]|nr:homoaconitate hydratase [Candidatus Paceibacterota bacterium]